MGFDKRLRSGKTGGKISAFARHSLWEAEPALGEFVSIQKAHQMEKVAGRGSAAVSHVVLSRMRALSNSTRVRPVAVCVCARRVASPRQGLGARLAIAEPFTSLESAAAVGDDGEASEEFVASLLHGNTGSSRSSHGATNERHLAAAVEHIAPAF